LFTQADLGEVDGCQAITFPEQEAWMNVHQNARLTPLRRRELVVRLERGERLSRVARRLGISGRTARKWWARFRTEGASGLADRSSRPHRSPRQTAPAVALGIKVLRRQRWTCAEIGRAVGVSAATAARVLRPLGLSRRGRCEARQA
jgi:transposase